MDDVNYNRIRAYLIPSAAKTKKQDNLTDFERKLILGNQELLDYLLNKSDEEVVDFVADRISNLFEINAKFERNKGFLHYAIGRGSKKIMSAIIDCRPDLDARDSQGRTPLHDAVIYSRFALLKILIERGASLDVIDSDGRTPLHYAAIAGRTEIAYFILSRGTPPNRKDRFSMTALDYSDNKGLIEMFRIFKGERSDYGNLDFDKERVPNSRYNRMRTYMQRVGILNEIYSKQLRGQHKKIEFNEVECLNHSDDTKKIGHKDFIIHDIIGKGSFGEVYLVEKIEGDGQ